MSPVSIVAERVLLACTRECLRDVFVNVLGNVLVNFPPFGCCCFPFCSLFLSPAKASSPAAIFAITMSTPPTMNDLARLAAANLTTFSAAHAFTPAREAKAARFLSAGTPVHQKRALILDRSTTAQWLVISNQQVVVVTCPFVATNTAGDPIFLASYGDSLTQATPVSLPDEATWGGVVALVTQDDHIALNLPGCAAVPGMLDPPPNLDGTPSTEQASIERLYFDTAGGTGSAPAFAVLPNIYLLALGEPPVLQPLADPFPATGIHSRGLRVWYEAMQHLQAHNAGISLHLHPGLFAATDLPASLFPTRVLVGATNTIVTTVDVSATHFGHVTTVHREAGHGAILAHAATLPAPPAPGALSTGSSNPSNPAFAAALKEAFTPLVSSLQASNKATASATTQVEREHQQDQQAVVARYQLLFGHVETVTDPIDGSTTESAVFPSLSAAFLAVLRPSKVNQAEASYRESITNHLRSNARSSSYFDGMTDMDAKSLGGPGISCLREFRWGVEPPTQDHDSIKDEIMIFHFARPDPASVTYQTRLEEGSLITRQHLVGEDKSKLKRKLTDLYYQGQISTGHDLKTAIANFYTFGTWAFPDFASNPPAVWVALAELVFTLNSPSGRLWTGRHKALPHVFLHLFIAVQHMLGPFVSLGNTLEYREAVLSGSPVAVAAYKSASAFALLQVHKVNNIIHQGDLGIFREAPSIMRIFYPNATGGTKLPSAIKDDYTIVSDLTSPVPRKKTTPDKKSPDSSSGSDPTVRGRAEGVMKFSGQGKPPVPKTLFPHPKSGKMTYLCGNASTVGYLCPRTKDECNFIHVTHPQDLRDKDNRTTLKTFITNHVDLSLAKPGT